MSYDPQPSPHPTRLALYCISLAQVSAELDESVQTAQDYAIVVDDPGEDDLDPDEVSE